MITVDTPQFAVTLVRMTNRTPSASSSYSSEFQRIDLTPYLGLGGQVNTQKALGQPCGAFSISFADRLHPEYGDTVYALAEPMDLVEIRGTRDPQSTEGGKLPLIMRGFVSSVSRNEQMAQDGTPYRTVTLVGQDSGKLLDILRVLFEFQAVLNDKSYIETFKLQAIIGIDVQVLPVADFMKQIIDKVVNPQIDKMVQFTHQGIKHFQTDTIVVKDGLVSPQLAASIDSVSMWQLMEVFADKPWNELFVRDVEDGPQLVFRPAPWRSYADDSYIIDGAEDPGTFELDISEVVSITTGRSDARVANFYWVQPGVTLMDSGMFVNMAALAQGWPLDLKHDANNPTIFGQRKMEARTNLYPSSVNQAYQMLPAADKQKAGNQWVNWQQARGRQLLAMNQDNSVFEEGTMLVKGSENLEIGTYLQLTRGDLVSQQYLETVAHQIQPLETWTTQLGFIRGTAYRERTTSASPPYIAEGRGGPYS